MQDNTVEFNSDRLRDQMLYCVPVGEMHLILEDFFDGVGCIILRVSHVAKGKHNTFDDRMQTSFRVCLDKRT